MCHGMSVMPSDERYQEIEVTTAVNQASDLNEVVQIDHQRIWMKIIGYN